MQSGRIPAIGSRVLGNLQRRAKAFGLVLTGLPNNGELAVS